MVTTYGTFNLVLMEQQKELEINSECKGKQ